MLARFRRLRIFCGIAVALGTGIPVVHAQESASQSQRTFQFNIPAKPLLAALVDFTDVTGVQLLYPSGDELKVTSRALSGTYSAQDALSQLLQGTGIVFRFNNKNTVTLAKQPAKGTRTLGPVRVEGSGSVAVNGINGARDVTATEGTGSYTSGALSVGSKTPLSMKETPQSVSVLTAQRLQEQNITDFTLAMAQTPGVTLVQGDSSLENVFYSRGFAINSIQIDGGAPLTTSFSNGKSFGFFPQIDLAQYDHVEVLRGAAGYFNGYGDPSGTVNLVRKKPLDHAQVSIEAQAGSWNSYRVVVDATRPLALDGRLRGRAIVTYQDDEYFYDLANDNKNLMYGIAEFDLTPSTLMTAGISHTRQDSLPWFYGLPRFQNGDDLRLPRSTCLCFAWNRWDFDTTEIFGGLEQRLGGDWSAKLNLTRNTQQSTRKLGFSQGPVNPLTGAGPSLGGSYFVYASEQSSAEATVFGTLDFLGLHHEITAGVNYVSSDGGGQTNHSPLIASTTAAPYQPYLGGPTYYPGSPNGSTPYINVLDFDAADPLFTEPRNPLPRQRYRELAQEQWGAYLNLRITAFDRLHLATGFRYSEYQSKTSYDMLCTSIPTSGAPAENNCVGRQIGDPYSPQDLTYHGDDFTWPPSVSLSFDVTRNLTAYVGYTDIYQSQANLLDGNLNPADPITGSNVEVGVKWQAEEGTLDATIAAYRIEQTGFAVRDLNSYGRLPNGAIDISYTVDNFGNRYPAGEVTPGVFCCSLSGLDITKLSQGVDAEISGEVLAGWQLSAGYTYNENKLQGADVARYDSTWVDGVSYVTLQPKHLFKLWTSYRFTRGWFRDLTLSAGANAQSKAFRSGTACVRLNPPNALGVSSCAPGQTVPYDYTVPFYSVWSTRADYRLNDSWAIALNVGNLFDKRYYKTIGAPGQNNWYGEPRSFTLTAYSHF